MHYLKFLATALFLTSAHGAELTLGKKPFVVSHTLKGHALPDQVTPVRVDVEVWTTFTIDSISAHGGSVGKGDVLVSFETEAIDEKITDTIREIATLELSISSAETDLENLEKTASDRLVRAKRKAETAAEELAYFAEMKRKASQETAEQGVERREQILASYEEELNQLLQMYEADDLTEDTEEIILKQQRDKVDSAKFSLRMERLEAKRLIEVQLPRKELSLAAAAEDSALEWKTAEREIPLGLGRKKLELEAMKTSLQRQRETLAELKSDRTLFEFKAPSDGRFYYGSIEGGKWLTGEIVKALVPKGSVPLGKTFATFIPDTANLVGYAFAKQSDAMALAAGGRGFATLSGLEDVLIPVKISALAKTPNPDGSYETVFAPEWPGEIAPAPGQALDIRVVSYAADHAITVPADALSFGTQGWTVEVKLADGKTERRAVSRGKTFGGEVEITDGLEVGQVIIAP